MSPQHTIPLLLLTLAFAPSTTADFSFAFPSLSLRNLTLLGDSYLRDGSVGLTRQSPVPCSSRGAILFNLPIPLSPSFATTFSFSLPNPTPAISGDGFAFLFASQTWSLGASGPFLGLTNSSSFDPNFIAVEFDTLADPQFFDPGSNHVGLDIGSLVSFKSSELVPHGIDLRLGNLINAWIRYDDDAKTFSVWLSYSTIRPKNPVLNAKIDLSRFFKESMFVGFAGSTAGSTELHVIDNWSFRTFGSNVSAPPSPPPPPRTLILPGPNLNSESNSHPKLGLGLGIGGSAFFVLSVLIAFAMFAIKRWWLSKCEEAFEPLELLKGPREFTYKELRSATKDFHLSRVIGSGAFGTVYRATAPPSSDLDVPPFAVKRSKHAHQGKREFMAELSIIARLRHKNLVRLLGWCADHGELLLVYEYMPNGNLDQALHSAPQVLDWRRRYNVVVGVASVMMYLHQECEQQVVHRDVKTSNVLLDAKFEPRLGDFGLARLTDHDKSPVSTLTAGTMGYLAPEYLQYGKATEKTDVFSFGVVCLEVATGRRPIDKEGPQSNATVNLVDWVWGLRSKERLIEAIDPRLGGKFNAGEAMRLLLVGLSCASPDCGERPSMRRVLQILNCEAEVPVVAREKPCPSFSCSLLPLNAREIIAECEESVVSSPLYEVKIV
ncbi:putative L-type lectin-domain containing receptor kinase S.7 [Acorus calamus]|uniref:non-specific serine/threonine protein kinase n=1 Tax=Acorus calamus TaxID=4465 RepID=A0AAV9EAG8_ACOCL|nr:putative L-type lectin-domain containing receptor kinase S.7 [Acorus calamus]